LHQVKYRYGFFIIIQNKTGKNKPYGKRAGEIKMDKYGFEVLQNSILAGKDRTSAERV
jgi:hypothetical protein